MNLIIKEIFYSLQGESSRVGLPTIFIRLTGCPLRCTYCDSAYAFKGGKSRSIEDILNTIQAFKTPYVTVTGGEPLAQKNCIYLLEALCKKNYQVSLETSGAHCIASVPRSIMIVMDIKSPSSGEENSLHTPNIEVLKKTDEVKLVVENKADYEWAKTTAKKYQLFQRCSVLLSPVHDALTPKTLAHWMLTDSLPFRFQIQLHKYIWGDEPGR